MTTPASQIGPYEITREIGRGGMGVVYLARDTKLDRDVAIKSLPPELAEDADRLARFEREAKTLASLNHPRIATIFGLEEAAGKQYLVLEYVEGETLDERLQRGAIPIEDALPLARQIAEAIEAAHDKGVIHRDLKPANIKFASDGSIKVLDFGLAKALDEPVSGSDIANSPTIVHSPTMTGIVLGTAGYLSPEQARGRPVDKRADIFAFGCVLFEMLTGEKLFVGDTVSDSLASTLKSEPVWANLPADTPPTIHLLLRRCLAKDRKRRMQDIGSARVEIEDAISDPSSSSLGLAAAIIEPDSHHLKRRLLTAVMLVITTGLAIAMTWFATSSLRRSSPPPPTVQLVIPSETDTYKYAEDMAVSPDGTQIAFIARRRIGTDISDQRRLWVRRLDEFDARELDVEASGDLFWSHDGRYIGFIADGGLWSIRADGADKRLLTTLDGASGATWNAAGEIIVGREGLGLQILRPGATSLEELTSVTTKTLDTFHLHPHFLPDGNRYLYLEVTFDPEQEFRSRVLYAGNLATGEQIMIGPFPSGAWYVEAGYLVYVEDGTVKSVSFDAEKLNITGEPIVLAQDAYYFKPIGAASISVSRDGVLVFNPVHARRGLAWFDAGGNRLGQVGTPANFDESIRISPDGLTVATSIEDFQTAQSDVVLLSLQRDTDRRLTFDARWEGDPVWSRDGKTIYLATDHRGPPAVYSLETSGDATYREIFRQTGIWFPSDVSPDGRFLAMFGRNSDTGRDLWIVPLDGEEEPFAFNSMRGDQRDARFSPDGTRIAYVSGETGSREIFVDTFPISSGGIQVSIHGGSSPVWSPDGRKLYFGQSPSGDRDWAIMVVEFSDSDPPSPLPPEVLFKPGPFEGFDLAPDGERFLLRLMPDGTPDNHVILNWVEALDSAGSEDAN